LRDAIRVDAALAHGVNTVSGSVTNGAVAEALHVECVDPVQALTT
jgi:alanine dehydrogenase